jgi:hypothetical protein
MDASLITSRTAQRDRILSLDRLPNRICSGDGRSRIYLSLASIKIDADEHVTQGLCVGEGVETCLAGRQMGLRPVWALLGTAGVEKFPVLPGVEGLHILRENDANLAGPKACETCAARWRNSGREVIFADPGLGSDLADEAAR